MHGSRDARLNFAHVIYNFTGYNLIVKDVNDHDQASVLVLNDSSSEFGVLYHKGKEYISVLFIYSFQLGQGQGKLRGYSRRCYLSINLLIGEESVKILDEIDITRTGEGIATFLSKVLSKSLKLKWEVIEFVRSLNSYLYKGISGTCYEETGFELALDSSSSKSPDI